MDFEYIKRFLINDVEYIKKDALFIFKSGKNNYGHCLVEMLPKIELAYRHGLLDHCTLVIPSLPESIAKIVDDVISLYSLKIGKPIDIHKMQAPVVRFDNIFYISRISIHNKIKSPIVRDFAQIITNNFSMPDKFINSSKFYLFRKPGVARSLINLSDVKDCAISYGFTPIDVEQLSFQEQVTLFKNSTHIIGDHGAALTNIVFASGACNVGMIDPGLNDFFFWDLACLNNQRFQWFYSHLQQWNESVAREPYSVDLKAIDVFFKNVVQN